MQRVSRSLISSCSQVFSIVKARADAKKAALDKKAKQLEQRVANRSGQAHMLVDVYDYWKQRLTSKAALTPFNHKEGIALLHAVDIRLRRLGRA